MLGCPVRDMDGASQRARAPREPARGSWLVAADRAGMRRRMGLDIASMAAFIQKVSCRETGEGAAVGDAKGDLVGRVPRSCTGWTTKPWLTSRIQDKCQ